jgi:hypothetical protein
VESLASGEKPVEAFAELSNGKARLAALPPGKYMVSVFAGSDAIGPARPPKAFELTAGQALDVTLRPGAGRISGIVRSGGKAVGGGTISWFLTPGLPGAVFQGGAQAQSDGSYAIDGLIEGKYRLIYEGPNSMLYECMAELRRNATAFDISLPTGRIEGTLAASAPKPEPPDVESLGNIRVWPREHHLPPHGGCFVEADPNGKFRVEHLIPDRYTIEGYGYRTSVLIDRDGEVATASLGPPEQVGEIAGKITGNIPANLGNVRDGIQVTAFPKDEFGYDFDSGTYSTRFNPKTGEYRIRNVPVGTYGVYAAGLGFGTSHAPQVWTPDIEVRQGLCRQLPIEVPEGRTVSITIRGQAAAGHRAAQCQYWWLRVPSGDWLDEAVSSNMERGGRYVLPLGAYAIKADYGDGGLVTREFTVARGEGVQEITVQPPALPATGPTSQRAP